MIISKKWSWVILSLFFWIIVFKFIPNGFYDLGGDSAQYIILAESLASGKGLRMLNYPGEPLFFYYPPLFPLLLWPIVFFFGRNFYVIHILVACLGYLSLFFLYQLFLKYTERDRAFITTACLATNWTFMFYSTNYILSDIPYLCFSSLALFWAVRYLASPAIINREGLLLLGGLLASYFSRYIGVTLFVGVIISLLLTDKASKYRKFAFLFTAFLFIFFMWNIFKSLIPTPPMKHMLQALLIDPYAPYKGTILAHPQYFLYRFIEGVNYYYDLIAGIFFSILGIKWSLLRDFLSSFVIGLTLWGFWLEFKKAKTCVFHYYFLLYFFAVVFWPYREDVRLFIPILPFIFFYFLAGLHRSLEFLVQGFATLCFSIWIVIFFLFSLFNLVQLHKSMPSNLDDLPVAMQHFIDAQQWLKQHGARGAVIISRKPTITYFYTGHKAIIYPYSFDDNLFWKQIKENKISYIVVDEFSSETYNYLLPFIRKHRDKFTPLYRLGNTGILEVRGR